MAPPSISSFRPLRHSYPVLAGSDLAIPDHTYSGEGTDQTTLPLLPGGRVVWAGKGSFARAHPPQPIGSASHSCLRVDGHARPYVCLQKTHEYYQWGATTRVAKPVACRKDTICSFAISTAVEVEEKVSNFKPSDMDRWLRHLAPSVPAGLGYAHRARIANRTVFFRGPGTKVLWFRPVTLTVVAKLFSYRASYILSTTTLPLTLPSGELDGVFGISDHIHPR